MKEYTKSERQKHLENWKRSSMSKAAYAKSAGIFPTTFYTWIRGMTGKKKRNFVEVKKQLLPNSNRDIIIEKGSILLRVPLSVAEKELQTIFAALEGSQ